MPKWRAPGEQVEKGVVPPPMANQGCSSAQWVPMEELEGGYDHSFSHKGVLGTPPRPSCTPWAPCCGGQKLNFWERGQNSQW